MVKQNPICWPCGLTLTGSGFSGVACYFIVSLKFEISNLRSQIQSSQALLP